MARHKPVRDARRAPPRAPHFERGSGRPIAFAVGTAELPAGGEPEAAMRAADEAMYRQKTKRAAVR